MTLDYIKTYRWQDMVVKGHFTFYMDWYRSRRGRFFMPRMGSTGPQGPVLERVKKVRFLSQYWE